MLPTICCVRACWQHESRLQTLVCRQRGGGGTPLNVAQTFTLLQLTSNHNKHTKRARGGCCEEAELCCPAELKSHMTTLLTHFVAHADVLISSLRIFMCRRELWIAQWTWTAWTGTCQSAQGKHARCYRWVFFFWGWEMGWVSEKERAWGLIVPKWFSIYGRKNTVQCSHCVTFQSGPILSQWALSSSDNCTHWCWMSPHWLLGQCFITRTLHNNDKHRAEAVWRGSRSGQAAQLGHVLTAYVTVL